MKDNELKTVLKNHALRVTDCRIDVLRYFLKQTRALTFKNLEEHLHAYDRVTLYRTLNSFTDHGILHKIPDDSGYASYGMCFKTCSASHHHHDHVHFKCMECGKIECLSAHLPEIDLPGYQVQEANLIVNGICQNCDKS